MNQRLELLFAKYQNFKLTPSSNQTYWSLIADI